MPQWPELEWYARIPVGTRGRTYALLDAPRLFIERSATDGWAGPMLRAYGLDPSRYEAREMLARGLPKEWRPFPFVTLSPPVLPGNRYGLIGPRWAFGVVYALLTDRIEGGIAKRPKLPLTRVAEALLADPERARLADVYSLGGDAAVRAVLRTLVA